MLEALTSSGQLSLLALAWVALFALLTQQLARHRHAIEIKPVGGLIVLALVVHGLGSHWAPGDARLNLYQAYAFGDLEPHWGLAPIALFRALTILVYPSGVVISTIHLLLSSLAPALLFCALRRLDFRTNVALLAAGLLVFHPSAIVYSTTLDRQPLIIFLSAVAVHQMLCWVQGSRPASLAASILAIVLAATSRPEGAALLAPLMCVVCFAPAERWRRWLFIGLCVAIGLACLPYVDSLTCDRSAPLSFLRERSYTNWADMPQRSLPFDTAFTPTGMLLVMVTGVALGLRTWATARLSIMVITSWVGLTALWLLSPVANHLIQFAGNPASAHYQMAYLPTFAIAFALMLDPLLALGKPLRAVGLCLVTVLIAWTYSTPYNVSMKKLTFQYEYDLLIERVASLPEDAYVTSARSPIFDSGFVDEHMSLTFGALAAPQWASIESLPCDEIENEELSLVLYVGSTCAEFRPHLNRPFDIPTARKHLAHCERLRELGRSTEIITERVFPARRNSWFEYADDTVTVGVYKIPPMRCTELQQLRLSAGQPLDK